MLISFFGKHNKIVNNKFQVGRIVFICKPIVADCHDFIPFYCPYLSIFLCINNVGRVFLLVLHTSLLKEEKTTIEHFRDIGRAKRILMQNRGVVIAGTTLLNPKFTVRETHNQFKEIWSQFGRKRNFAKVQRLKHKSGQRCKVQN